MNYIYKSLFFLGLVVFFVATQHTFAWSQVSPQRLESFSDIAKKVQGGVINIYSSGKTPQNVYQYFRDRLPQQATKQTHSAEVMSSLGSGFVISASGQVLTNYHVIKNAGQIFAKFNDNESLPLQIIGTDEKTDLALLQLPTTKKYPYVSLGDSTQAQVGDWVLAIGNPFGLGQTLTAGIISGKGRVLGFGPYDDYIQTDASINPGNSGGPLFNVKGEVIAINTAKIQNIQGIGFAIPINLAKNIVTTLQNSGKIKRAWLGATVISVNDILAKKMKLTQKNGLVVTDVDPSGPSQNALKVNDIILSVNNSVAKDIKEFSTMLLSFRANDKVTFAILRQGQKQNVTVTLGDLDNPHKSYVAPVEISIKDLEPGKIGIDVRPIETTDQLKITEGVYITKIHEQSLGEKLGLKRGDVIVAVNDVSIVAVKNLKKELKAIANNQNVILKIVRDGQEMTVNFQKKESLE